MNYMMYIALSSSVKASRTSILTWGFKLPGRSCPHYSMFQSIQILQSRRRKIIISMIVLGPLLCVNDIIIWVLCYFIVCESVMRAGPQPVLKAPGSRLKGRGGPLCINAIEEELRPMGAHQGRSQACPGGMYR